MKPVWCDPCLAILALCGTVSCIEPTPSKAEPSEARRIRSLFQDATAGSGLDFVHLHGGTGRKYLPEIMGSGGCVLDFDGDGFLDVYLVQSGELESDGTREKNANRLFRNLGNGRFQDVTAESRTGDRGYGMGAAAADYDNDGDPDIYITNYGLDTLLMNNGDGTFSDVTQAAGIGNSEWASSAAFFDADQDGHLDIYVTNYVEFTTESHVDCGQPARGILSYCSPDVYPGVTDVFWRNRGDGTFEDKTRASGLAADAGKGLGVVAVDFNRDGWSDLYVANDSTPNFLYQNRGDGTFEEIGLFVGVSHNEDGLTEAGMGVDAGDVNGDGLLDIVVTNLSNESNALYVATSSAGFAYQSRFAGLHEGSFIPVGFGIDLLDLDHDADLDIVVANGHILDNVELIDDGQTFRQAGQVFLNDGRGNFSELPKTRVGDLSVPRVGRSILRVDVDNNGTLELVVTFNNDKARLFRNPSLPGNWIGFDLRAERGSRDGLGTRVTVEAAGRRMVEEKKSGSGYQSSSDARLHFGLGISEIAERVTVRWPSGAEQTFSGVEGGGYYLLIEGHEPVRR